LLLQSPKGNLWGERLWSSWIDPFWGNYTLTLDKRGCKLQWEKQLKYSRSINGKKEKGKKEEEVGWI
jgi:hypothetical protein